MIKRFGKFGWVCVTVIVVTLAISLCVEAKNKKKKHNKKQYNIERFFQSSSFIHDEAPRNYVNKENCGYNKGEQRLEQVEERQETQQKTQ